MAPTDAHTFDRYGDLLLILSELSNPANPPKSTEERTSTKGGIATSVIKGQVTAVNQDGEDGISSTPAESVSSGHCVVNDTVTTPMFVSSRHMMLVSLVFRTMLSGNFKERREPASDGKVQVPLPNEDPTSFAIVLDIVHSRNRRVPKHVDLELLTRISIIVDKYQMVEAVESFSDGWIERLKKDMPTTYGLFGDESKRKFHRWMPIAWVFNLQSEFKSVTQVVARATGAGLKNEIDSRLPIPSAVLGMLSLKDVLNYMLVSGS
jgi:hypothetical protein